MKTELIKNKKLIIISVCVFALLAALLAAAYFLMTAGSARGFYLQAEAKNFNKYTQQIKKLYRDFYDSQKPYMNGRYKSRAELSADINSDSKNIFTFTDAGAIFDVIKKCKLIVDSNNDPGAKKSLTRLSLLLESSPLLDATVYNRDRQLGINIPVLFPDRYFTLDMDKLETVYQRLLSRYSLPLVTPKRTLKAVDFSQTIKYSDEDLDALIKEYAAFFSGLIGEADVRYGEKVKFKVGEETVKARKVVVTLGSVKTQKLIQGLADKLSNDDRLMQMTYGNYKDVISMFDEAGLFQLLQVFDDYGSVKMNDTLKQYLNRLKSDKDPSRVKALIKGFSGSSPAPKALNMVLVIDRKGTVLDRVISIPLENGNEKIDINIHSGSNDAENDNFKNGFVSIDVEKSALDGEKFTYSFNINSRIKPQPGNIGEKGEVSLSYIKKSNDLPELDARLKLGIDKGVNELTRHDNKVNKFELSLKNGKSGLTDSFSGAVTTESWKNNKHNTRNSNTGYTINIDAPSLDVKGVKLKLDMAKEDRFEVEDFSLPDVEPENAVDLSSITDGRLSEIETELMASFGVFYISNKPLIDTLLHGW